MITVRSDEGYLTFEQDGREFYDSAIPCEADIGRWFRHMNDKMWMTPELKQETIKIIGDYYEDQKKN